MQEFLRWLARWKGITVEDGAEMQFEFSGFPGGGLGLLVLVALLLLLVFVAFVYRRDGKTLRTWQRVALGSLRALAVLAAAALLLEPNLVAVKHETRPGHTILLVDTSQSMNQLDAFRRDDVQAIASGWRTLGVANPAGSARIDLLRTLLGYHDGELVARLAARNQVQLYGFSAGIEPLPQLPPPPPALGPDGKPQAPQQAPPPRVDVAKVVADGRYSNLGGSLRAALEKSRSNEVAAVIVLSDGRRNAGPQGAEVARMLNQRKVPHTFVLGIGDPSATQTVGIGRFEAPEKVFQKDPFEMRASVVSQGYEPTTATVRLVRTDDKGAEEVVRTQDVPIGGEAGETAVEFKDLTSAQTGRFTYRVEVQPPSGEPPVPERHRKSVAVEVLGERTRVLLLAGCSSHEFQILRNLLIRDKTIDVSCWLQSADPKFPQDGDEDVRIEQLPEEQQQFDPYDVAILIDPNPAKLSPAFCEMLRKHVTENGCGLWWVCGEKFSLAAFQPTAVTRPLVELLPVHPDVRYAESVAMVGLGLAHTQAWPYALTPEGEDGIAAKVTRLVDGKDESRILWSRLPGFYVAFPVREPKPAATVIAEHRNADPRLRREGGHGMPLIATQFVGAGRVLFHGMDETYRWRSIFEDAYDTYWVKGIRYLFEGRIHAGDSRLRILIGDEKVELGDAVTITVESRNEVLQPLIAENVELSLEREGQPVETLRLEPVEEAPGTYQAQVRPTQTGSYRVRAPKRDGRQAEAGFQVVPAQIEREGPVDRAELAAIAGAAGGRLFDSPVELLAALDDIPSRSATDTFRTPHALWDGWATVAFLVAVLAVEWLLRKRFNLL